MNLLAVTVEHVDRSRPVGKDGRGDGNFISGNFLYKPITLMKFREMFMGLNEGSSVCLLSIHFVTQFFDHKAWP